MNYASIYSRFIEKAKGRKWSGYKEFHHILPVGMGGGDEKENLVCLTAREHFFAHLLLIKMHPDQRCLVFAAHMMTIGGNRNNRNRDGLKKPKWLYKKHRAAISGLKKGNTHMLGKRHSAETKAKMSASQSALPYRKRYPLSDQTKRKLSIKHTGVKKSFDHCESMSKAGQKRATALSPYSDGSARVPGVVKRPNGMFVARANARAAAAAVMPFLA